MWSAMVGNAVNGQILGEIAADVSWHESLDSSSVQVSLGADKIGRGIAAQLAPWRTWLAAAWDGTPIVAGPIKSGSQDLARGTISLSAGGFEEFLARRILLPGSAHGHDIVDEGRRVTGRTLDPTSDYDTTVSGSWPQIVASLLQGAMDWPNGLPSIITPTGTGGAHSITYPAADVRWLGDALNDIVAREDGAEIRWIPEIQGGRMLWRCRVGTDADPLITSRSDVIQWDIGRPAMRLAPQVALDASRQVNRMTMTGGKTSDEVLYVAADNQAALAVSPMIEGLDSSRQTVDNKARLWSAVKDQLWQRATPTVTVTVDVPTDGYPQPDQYRCGDWVELVHGGLLVWLDDPAQMRIVSRSGGTGSPISVTLVPAREQDRW